MRRSDWLLSRSLFHEVDDLVRAVDSWFDHTPARGLDGRHGLTHVLRPGGPRLEIAEQDDAYVVRGDVPGLTPEALTVTLEGDVLTLSGSTEPSGEVDDDGWRTVRRERVGETFERRLRFSKPLDTDGIVARVRDGVLTIHLPKAAPKALTVTVQG